MKLKKFISGSVALGILLNSIPINSFAGILSEGTRYETFKGNSMKINDILEEDNIDVEIEGNTLVNLVFEDEIKENNTSIYYCNKNYNIGSGVYTIKNLSSKPIWIGIFSADNPTNYLRCITIEGNSSVTHVLNANECFVDIVGKFSDGWTTKDKKLLEKSILIFNGKVDNVNIPRYFNGIKSTSELENNKIKIVAQEYNEFTDSTNGLICHFKPNSSSVEGNVLKDLSGNNNNATLINIDSSSIGNNYIQFNGIDSYATVNRIIEDDFTIMVKAQVDAVSGTVSSTVNSNKNQWFNHAGIIDGEVSGITYDFGITITEDGYPAFGIGNPDKTYFHKKNCFGSIKTYILSRNKNQGVIKVYVDGELVREIEDTTQNSLTAPTKLSIAKANYWGLFTKMKLYELKIYNKSLEQNEIMKSNEKEIVLKEPLRSLPNGTKDRIIKRNGQWVVERNVGEIILDGSRSWQFITLADEALGKTKRFLLPMSEFPNIDADNFAINKPANIISDKYTTKSVEELVYNDTVGIGFTNLFLSIRDEDMSIEKFKEKLKTNNIKVLYPLKNTVYEPLNTDSVLLIYEGATYISNDSIIPATMKVKVDRIINKSSEAIEEAVSNPTLYNISLARMWINQMPESLLKDEMQMRLSNISNISDMVLDRKLATSNLDVYIKSENILQISLDTNQISF